jgi:glycopeptide antibiotics resistance protein
VILDRRLARLLMAAYLVVVAFIVWWPTPDHAIDSVSAIRSVLLTLGAPDWLTPLSIEFVTNVLLFVPLSVLGHTFRPHWRWGRWTLAGLAGTLLIETVQLLFLPSRSAALVDVVANTLGAVVGYAVVRVLRRR